MKTVDTFFSMEISNLLAKGGQSFGSFSSGLTILNGDTVFLAQERRFQQINHRISATAWYPFSQVMRLELSGGFRNITSTSPPTSTSARSCAIHEQARCCSIRKPIRPRSTR